MTDLTAVLSLFFRDDGRSLAEGDVDAFDGEGLEPFETQEGFVTLSANGQTLTIGDDLGHVVSGLCLGVPDALREDGTYLFEGFATPINTTFVRSGDSVTVTRDYAAPMTFPADALLSALRGVAERFPALLMRLWPDTPAVLRDAYADAVRNLPTP